MSTSEQNFKTAAKPPTNARRVFGNRDLPPNRGKAHYRITTTDGRSFERAVGKRKRQVLEALMRAPVYCASPVRISDLVCTMKADDGIQIKTEMFKDKRPPAFVYGIYVLADQVEYLGDVSA